MFTGVIRDTGKLNKKIVHTSRAGGLLLEILCSTLHPELGDSIAVNGICLTVVKKTKKSFWVDVVSETLSRTTINDLPMGSPLNLEQSLRMNDPIDGHFVTGHVDGTGTVSGWKKGKNDTYLEVLIPQKLKRFVVEKGSIAVNGVSLTVAQTSQGKFFAAIIPYTLEHTNLGMLKKGDHVNIEVDILARYSQSP